MTAVHCRRLARCREYSKAAQLYLPIQAGSKNRWSTRSWRPRTRISTRWRIDFTHGSGGSSACAAGIRLQPGPQGASRSTQAGRKEFLRPIEVSFTAKLQGSLWLRCGSSGYRRTGFSSFYLKTDLSRLGAYGSLAASLVYFDKSVNELTPSRSRPWLRCPRLIVRSLGEERDRRH